MDTLNRQRACLCFSHLFDTGSVLSPEEISKKERIFERSSFIRWNGGDAIGRATMGVSIFKIVSALGSTHHITNSVKQGQSSLTGLIDIFAEEDYLLCYAWSQDTVLIALKESIRPVSQLQAWAHAMLLIRDLQQRSRAEREDSAAIAKLIDTSLRELKSSWTKDTAALAAAGWDLDVASLETVSGTRVSLAAGTPQV